MKTFLKQLFAYHHFYNQKIIEMMVGHSEAAYHGKIQHLFSHSINAQQIWNARILNQTQIKLDQLHDWAEAKKMDAENHQKSLLVLADFELDTVIAYKNSTGKAFQRNVQQILFHICNHFTHHRGQIIMLMRQSAMEPLSADFIFYEEN